jgi:hypothetical protein
MWVTGYTSNRLSEIKTLDRNNPYKVGVNGVFNVTSEFVEYELDGIFYKTYINTIPFFFQRGRDNIDDVTLIRSYTSPNSEPNNQDTIFKYKPSKNNFTNKPLIKEEVKLEQVFLPKIEDDIFIERTSTNIYEKHMRLMDINTLDGLETYKNGFFGVKKV